ncbi:MAG: heme ABC transporter ATP-binding protein [Bacteroidia bacterium]|nr:heme ABC transporter ATP-binding protein [Bacteroidia bacterium]
MLVAENISYKIGDKTLLENVSLSFEPGKLNLIIGPNGAGKSTLIKTLCNQIRPDTGHIFYANRDINKISITELARIRSVLSQNIELAFPLRVNEVVMMGRYPHFVNDPTEQDELACMESMQFFDVDYLSDRNYMTLSGGEKQRVHFARVISQIWYPITGNYRYLFLDEPLTFLDVRYQFNFMRKIVELLKNTDIVVVGVVHDLNLAAKFSDKIILLNDGKVIASGNKYEVLTKENVKTTYQLEPVIVEGKESLYLFFD